jgi:hypothetical protein
MPETRNKPFKLKVLGIVYLEAENWSVTELAVILGMVMVFVSAVIILLRIEVLPKANADAVWREVIVNALKDPHKPGDTGH